MSRDERQANVLRWIRDTFGDATLNPRERVLRVLEEAIELAQAEGIHPAEAGRVLEHVYNKPPGDPAKEVGGVGVTLLGYCAVKGISADDAERTEAARVFAIDPATFRARHNAKAAAGIAAWTDARLAPSLHKRMPTPEDMHGAADGFGGEDFPSLPRFDDAAHHDEHVRTGIKHGGCSTCIAMVKR